MLLYETRLCLYSKCFTKIALMVTFFTSIVISIINRSRIVSMIIIIRQTGAKGGSYSIFPMTFQAGKRTSLTPKARVFTLFTFWISRIGKIFIIFVHTATIKSIPFIRSISISTIKTSSTISPRNTIITRMLTLLTNRFQILFKIPYRTLTSRLINPKTVQFASSTIIFSILTSIALITTLFTSFLSHIIIVSYVTVTLLISPYGSGRMRTGKAFNISSSHILYTRFALVRTPYTSNITSIIIIPRPTYTTLIQQPISQIRTLSTIISRIHTKGTFISTSYNKNK